MSLRCVISDGGFLAVWLCYVFSIVCAHVDLYSVSVYWLHVSIFHCCGCVCGHPIDRKEKFAFGNVCSVILTSVSGYSENTKHSEECKAFSRKWTVVVLINAHYFGAAQTVFFWRKEYTSKHYVMSEILRNLHVNSYRWLFTVQGCRFVYLSWISGLSRVPENSIVF